MRFIWLALILLSALPAGADHAVRIATYSAAFSRDGPGLLLRDLAEGDKQSDAAVAVIATVAPDVLLLTEFDYDAGGAALDLLAHRLRAEGLDYPHRFAAMPNTGMHTGLDLNGNGRFYEGADAQGFGRFPGDGGMAVLSRYPLGAVTDLSGLLWADLPGGHAAQVLGPKAMSVQRLSTTAHWIVPVDLPDGPLTLLCFAATAPVFDGPEDRNGLRNADEIGLWQRLLDGDLDTRSPEMPFVLMGRVNLDPYDGEGRHDAIRALLADPRLQDPLPVSAGGFAAADPAHRGDPAADTANWQRGTSGNLRVDYILPSSDAVVHDAAVLWPIPEDPLAAAVASAGAHRMIWADLILPSAF